MSSTAMTTTQPSSDKLAPFRAALAKAEGHFKMALPATVQKFLTPERLTKITLSAISRNPILLQCTPESVLRSVMDAASLGLEPSGGVLGHAYLVPYRNGKTGKYEAQLIVGYRGLIALARRSTDIQSVEAHVVYERDTFTVEYGINPKLVHVPTLSSDRGQIVAVYCVASFKDGARHAELMTIAEVESIRMRSRARDNGPWKTDYAEMCRKTVVRRAAKYWPLSTEFVRALEHEDDVETGDRTELPALSSDVDVAGELAAGNDDLGDGEVVAPAAEPSKTSRLAEQIRSQKVAPASEPAGDEPPPQDDGDQPPFPEAEARAQAEAARKGETKTREQREAEFRAKHKGAREPGADG